MAAATLASPDATAMDDRRLLELLIMVVIYSLLRKEGAAAANDDDAGELKDMVTELSMSINGGGDQSAVSNQLLLAITQRLLDEQLRLLDGGENERRVEEVSSSASDHQLMETAAEAKKKEKAAAAKMKKKRNKRNKAAAKHKGTKRMSWLGGGIISLLMMAVFGFGSIMTLSHIPQSDGSSEGNKAPPTLPPSTSTSLRQRDLQSSNNIMSSMSPSSVSPLAVVVQAPVFSPDTATVSNPPTYFPTVTLSLTTSPKPSISPKPSSSPTKSATPSSSPTISSSPTKSATPSSSPSSAPSMCTDTEGWYGYGGYDCSWYEAMDVPGCPQYGSQNAHYSSTAKGSAKDNCCYCKNAVVSTVSPTKAPSSSGTCVDTPGWMNFIGDECEWYQKFDDPGCPKYGNRYAGEMDPAADNCCYCKDPTCEDFKWKCQYYNTHSNDWWWTNEPDRVKNVCDEAASSCCKTADHVKVVTNPYYQSNQTVGLYDECKCDFWLRLCEDTRGGDACDYAAEYCCGDYSYYKYHIERGETEVFEYLNSPQCYCDFFNYAQNELGHDTLKPKALNMNIEFSNPCGQFEEYWSLNSDRFEIESLEAIYNATNGQNWTNNDGWMNETVNICQWYGISCDDGGSVTSIDLKDNNLDGQFPVYSRNVNSGGGPILVNNWQWTKYGLANLYKLKTLDLAGNKLTGTIEYGPLYNLHSLTHFDVSGNQLSGEVDALVAPSLTSADFSSNNFTTMRRFQKYKVSPLQTLRYCDVSNNAIQEDATDLLENIPSNIEQLIASNNQIYGSLPASVNNLQKLRQFNMSSNALSGELPVFAGSILSLQELDVSNQTNGFTGSIPEDIWRLQSLKILNLAGNRLTSTIPRTIGNMAVLELFDLSNNRLDSSIPPELGMLEGSLKRLVLSNNALYGIIPFQIGQLQGASVFLNDNLFRNNSTTAPLILCVEREVKEFDLADDTTLCPTERNALSDFFDSAKGAEWTDRLLWLDEYASYCDWKGVTCDDDKNHVTKLNLTNNGLSGRLSESIGNLTFIEVLDLSDNDIKGSIPAEIGLLKNLTYLRLSYNAFTGAAPEGLGEMKGLQLLQLQSNRITEMPIIPRLDNSIFGQSTFVTDCGVPSAFDEALECKNCTMCCNANDDCYPQEETQVQKMGSAAITFACFIAFYCIVFLSLYKRNRRKNRGITLTESMETMLEEDDKYALSKIGKDSVYSYFVTGQVWVRVQVRARTLTLTGWWWAAFVTFCTQIGILVVFIMASEAKLQKETIDIQFTWKCPRDKDVCEDKNDLTPYGWVIFCVLMVVFLAKDMISGCKLIYHSAKVRHPLSSRIRYFFGGTCLCSITLFALYVSTVYNIAIATRDTELIVNSVIVLFVMEMDECIFAALEAIDEKWTAHAVDGSENTNSDIAEMKEKMTRQSEQIASQQEQITSQQEDLRKLREIVEKLQDSQAQAAAAAATAASDSESVSDCEGETKAHQMEQTDEITMTFDGEQNMQEPRAAADTPDSHLESDTEEDLQE